MICLFFRKIGSICRIKKKREKLIDFHEIEASVSVKLMDKKNRSQTMCRIHLVGNVTTFFICVMNCEIDFFN